jgi:hypothetical protein
MVLECLAATAIFALTCGAVLLFMKLFGFEASALAGSSLIQDRPARGDSGDASRAGIARTPSSAGFF